MGNPVKSKERTIKTISPVVVLDIDELDKILNNLTMLIGKEKETDQTRLRINHNAKQLRTDLHNYKRRLTEYYKIKTD